MTTPPVWTIGADYASRHPGEVRAFALSGGWVRICTMRGAHVETVWVSAEPPPFWDDQMDDTARIERMLREIRSEGRRSGWERQREGAAA